jgi:outer membrane receptor protein involved in Fe transport
VCETLDEMVMRNDCRLAEYQLAVRRSFTLTLIVLALLSPAVEAQEQPQGQAPAQPPAKGPTEAAAIPQSPAPLIFNITVVGNTPLQGSDLPISSIPAPVQTATNRDLDRSGALEVSDFLNRRLNGVHVNDIQSNPFQPDVSYRGYTASPLLGTPQGLSVYMDGVRLNQPFGDIVSWDLIPRLAISSIALMPGSNPLFGLNTLGGALSLETKNGARDPGTLVQAIYGSHTRRAIEFEHGGSRAGGGWHWYTTGNFFDEDGWREDSPSQVGQLFGKLGWRRPRTDASVSAAYADNSLNGNGLQESGFLDRDYSSVYTKPDTTENRSTIVNGTARHSVRDTLILSGTAYYRRIHSNTLNGDSNEDSLDQALYQPNAVERAALTAAGYTGFPVSGETADNTPFPYWRCIAQVVLREEPAEKCNGLINRTQTRQHHAGASGQFTWLSAADRSGHQVTAGTAFDYNAAHFLQSSELGYLNPDRSVTGTGAFADGVTGGEVDGEPFDSRVDLDGHTRTFSFYATDTFRLRDGVHATLSGRFNRTVVENVDAINPGGGTGSLDGTHTFSRFNPAAGLTFDLPRRVNAYVGYSEGSRAATSIELGCADPESPCKLPNAMTGDPPLDQVVTRTFEIGLRSTQRLRWNAGYFLANNRDDILFVMSEQTGFGYFRNFGSTRRQGVEAGADTQVGRVTLGLSYTFLDATFQSPETLNGESNSSNDEGQGLEGVIDIEPGARMPLIPRHMFKAFGEIRIRSNVSLDLGMISSSGVFARGNENNAHEPDGTYYTGEGATPAYAVVNLGARYQVTRHVGLVLQINNLFDTRYYTAAQLGANAFTETGAFIARPFPPIDGEFPLRHGTFLAPGAPAAFWIGARLTL